MQIWIRRAYEPPGRVDGPRILVDRLWPRGVSKEALRIDAWLKDVAPSTKLREWFGHDPERWETFQARYFVELDRRRGPVEELLRRARQGRVTLVQAARDPDHNNAVALRAHLLRARAA